MSPAQATSRVRDTRLLQAPVEKSSDWCPLIPEAAGKYSVQVAATLDAVEALRPIWRKWSHSLDTDIDYFLFDMAHDPESLHPFVITVYNEGVPQAMLVGKVKNRKASSIV